ncbi:MAG: hypothetical protein ACI9WU_000235, partial [Myxococcota bacterium]
ARGVLRVLTRRLRNTTRRTTGEFPQMSEQVKGLTLK